MAANLAMKFNGMRVLSHNIKGEEPGLSRWIVKLQGCELNHQTAGLAIDALGELGILYDESPHVRLVSGSMSGIIALHFIDSNSKRICWRASEAPRVS